ncbi:MAG TPA: hypothetical protein VIL78_15580 [Hanamia sp.]
MYSGFKLNIVVTSILVCSFGTAAKAQLASNKSISEIYNKKINEKLAEKNKTKQQNKSLLVEQNLPSERASLKDVANIEIKKSKIVVHDNSTQSDEEKKNKLASNSPKLKQLGKLATKSPRLPMPAY